MTDVRTQRSIAVGAEVAVLAGTGIGAATQEETIELPVGTELRLTLRGAVSVTR